MTVGWLTPIGKFYTFGLPIDFNLDFLKLTQYRFKATSVSDKNQGSRKVALKLFSRALCLGRRSAGGMEGEAGQSVTAWGITVGSKLASGVTKICR